MLNISKERCKVAGTVVIQITIPGIRIWYANWLNALYILGMDECESNGNCR